ncbi:MAG: transporter substrate-binding domain-containing protein [Deltaproteobacteria bacterium]|jgi:ABC-type amino acid transport substrate-binding protein|nr:transporter substrate-binding domain-containing protein [Deltaproteobacteria bacterium]
MIKKTILVITISIFLNLIPAIAEEKKIYKVAVDNYYPPFSYIDPLSDKLEGLAVDVARKICEDVNISCEFVGMEHSETFAALENKEIDFICVAPGLRIDVGSLFLNSEKYIHSSSAYVGLKGVVKEVTPQTLTGLRVGVIRGSLQDWYLSAKYPKIIEEIKYEDFDDITTALVLKEIDLGLVDIMATYYFMQKDKEMAFDVFGHPVNVGDGAFMMVLKSNPELLRKLNEAILSIHTSSKFDSINAKYYDFFIF